MVCPGKIAAGRRTCRCSALAAPSRFPTWRSQAICNSTGITGHFWLLRLRTTFHLLNVLILLKNKLFSCCRIVSYLKKNQKDSSEFTYNPLHALALWGFGVYVCVCGCGWVCLCVGGCVCVSNIFLFSDFLELFSSGCCCPMQ